MPAAHECTRKLRMFLWNLCPLCSRALSRPLVHHPPSLKAISGPPTSGHVLPVTPIGPVKDHGKAAVGGQPDSSSIRTTTHRCWYLARYHSGMRKLWAGVGTVLLSLSINQAANILDLSYGLAAATLAATIGYGLLVTADPVRQLLWRSVGRRRPVLVILITGLVTGLLGSGVAWVLVKQERGRAAKEQHKAPKLAPQQGPATGELASLKGNLQAVRIPGPGSPNTRLAVTKTEGASNRLIAVGVRPTKILVEPPTVVISDGDLPKEVPVPGGSILVKRFSADGIILDERGTVGVELRITILEGEAPQRLDANRELANELATLRDHGYSVYNNWWTYCTDDKKWEQHFGESRSWQRVVVTKLRDDLHRVDLATEFNLPDPTDQPPSTNVVNCPRPVLLIEHFYRVKRLGDIIKREFPSRG